MLVLDGLGPGGDGICRLQPQVRRRDGRATVAALLASRDVRLLERLAQVVEVEADRRTGQLPGPFARRRIERNVDALESVVFQLFLQQSSQTLVEVRERSVERYVNYQPHCHPRSTIYLAATRPGAIPPGCSGPGPAPLAPTRSRG